MSSEVEVVEIDDSGKIILPYKIREKIGIHPHDKLIIGVKNNTLIVTKQKTGVFDLQLKEDTSGTLKKALIFERKIDKPGKKDML